MSAGICIMNRNAIAMAADSAVTVGDHAAIHNSANKLFSLSRVAPVGVIVYANAALMTVPIEIIVKQYKKQLADRVFPKLNDYFSLDSDGRIHSGRGKAAHGNAGCRGRST